MLRTALVRGAFEFQGQKCSAASRAYVPRSVWARLRDDLVATTESLPMGDVTDFSNFMGAVIDRKSFSKLSGVLDRAKDDDALTVVAGGTADDSEGFFVRPTIIEGTDPGHEVFTTEYFGPVLAVHVYDDADYDAVLTQMESVAPYALTGSVIAQDRAAIAHAQRFLRYAAGNFYVNDKPTGAVVGQQPFGGGAGLGHQRQGRRRAEPAALDEHPLDQGDVRPARPTTATRTWAEAPLPAFCTESWRVA